MYKCRERTAIPIEIALPITLQVSLESWVLRTVRGAYTLIIRKEVFPGSTPRKTNFL